MDLIEKLRLEMGADWLPSLYGKIRAGRTRAVTIEVPARKNRPEIQHTLLGIELRVGRRRFSCPDLATARYLRVFARVGVSQFAIPYNIALIPAIADELETAWQRSLVLLESIKGDNAAARRRLLKALRSEINTIGPGEAMPAFDRETRNRPNT